MVVLVCGFVVVNVHPRVEWFSENFYMPDELYEHGWPFSYMTRGLYPPEADMGGIIYHPWPWRAGSFGPAPLLKFHPFWLIIDIAVAASLVVSSIRVIESLVKRTGLRLRFGIRHFLLVIAIICACLAITAQFVSISSLDLELSLLLAVQIVPNCLVIASLALSCLLGLKLIHALVTSKP